MLMGEQSGAINLSYSMVLKHLSNKTFSMVTSVISNCFFMCTNLVEMSSQLSDSDGKVKVKKSLHFFDHVGDVL